MFTRPEAPGAPCSGNGCQDPGHAGYHGARRAEAVLRIYRGTKTDIRDEEELLTDLLTDVMHWAKEQSPNLFAEALSSSQTTHFPAEQAEQN